MLAKECDLSPATTVCAIFLLSSNDTVASYICVKYRKVFETFLNLDKDFS